jgi:hypothetical protein
MNKDYKSYTNLEKETLLLLDWMLSEIERREKAGLNIGREGGELKKMFRSDKAMIIERAQKRLEEIEEWNRPDLSTARRTALKTKMDLGKQMDEALINMRNTLLEDKLRMLNWGNKVGDA